MTSGPRSRDPLASEPSAATVESLVRGIQARDGLDAQSRRPTERGRATRGRADPRADRKRDRGPWLGLLGATEWERLTHDEAVRQRRYGHVHAILIGELRGLDPDEPPPNSAAIERTMPACGATLLRAARASDRIGLIGPGRFGILLRESDAIGAGRFAARAVDACDPWLRAADPPMRLALGWSAPDGDGELGRARSLAERHLQTGRRA